MLPTADSPAERRPTLPRFLPKKNTNASRMPTARVPLSAGRISVSTPVPASLVRADRNVPSENAFPVRAERVAGVLHRMFPTVQVRASTRVTRISAPPLHPHVQEAEPITPAPVRVHPAAQERNAREVHA